jgi:hypothetical protein
VVFGAASVQSEGAGGGYRAKLTDLSLGGCYLQTLMPLPIGASLVLSLTVGETAFEAAGIVRTCHPNLGMGVEFTGQPDPRLRGLMRQLNAGAAADAPPPDSAAAQKADAPYTAKRVESVSHELRDLMQLLQCTEVEPHLLRQFRDVLGEVRNTAWAIQHFLESEGGQATPQAQLRFLTHERIRLATKLCAALSQDMGQVPLETRELKQLVDTVAKMIAAVSKR